MVALYPPAAQDVDKEILDNYAQMFEREHAQCQELVEALELARQFIVNGVEFGYITMPDVDTPDSAHETLPMIDAALAKYKGELNDRS